VTFGTGVRLPLCGSRAARVVNSSISTEITTTRARAGIVVAIILRATAVRSDVAQLAVRQYVQGTFRITRLLRMADANQVPPTLTKYR
jgi:hypothetical protein